MKKSIFVLSLLIATAISYSQNYNISFTASGTGSNLDSVKIENLTQETSITIDGEDTLHLFGPDVINNFIKNEGKIEVYPNPMQGFAEISFSVNQTGNVRINIIDISSKSIIQTVDNLQQGTHKYEITGLKQGVYFINIIGTNFKYTTKLISVNTSQTIAKLNYLVNEKPEIVNNINRKTKAKAIISMAYTTGNMLRYIGYFGNTTYSIYDVPSSSKTVAFIVCNNLTIIHNADTVSPISKTITYKTAISTLGGFGSKCWITQNLGADSVASSANDNTDIAAGWYWQFNHKQGYNINGTVLTPIWTITSINENSEWIAANDPCSLFLGSGWRLPTNTEWNNVDVNANWNNSNDTYNSVLKLHNAGCINTSGSLYNRGSYGYFWSNKQFDNSKSYSFNIGSSNSEIHDNLNKALGFSVRCLRE